MKFAGLLPVAAVLLLIAPMSARSEPREPTGTIAVVSSADFRTVLLVAARSGGVNRVRSPDRAFSLRADVTRDGKQIAIAGLRGIWIFQRRQPSLGRRVVVSPPTAFAPDWVTWSPNEKQLVFTRDGSLFIVAIDRSSIRRLLRGHVYAPDWSPTVTTIVFVRYPSIATGEGIIQSIRPDGHGRRSLVRGGHPDISPDGSRLAFARREGVYVMPMKGGEPRLIIRNGDRPEWSPDGRHLAFTRYVRCGHAGCSGRVFVVPASGGKERAVGPQIFQVGPLSWSE
jgi:Tol biopolymer transport system component